MFYIFYFLVIHQIFHSKRIIKLKHLKHRVSLNSHWQNRIMLMLLLKRSFTKYIMVCKYITWYLRCVIASTHLAHVIFPSGKTFHKLAYNFLLWETLFTFCTWEKCYEKKRGSWKETEISYTIICDTIFVSVVIYNDNCSTGGSNQI